MLFMAEWVIIEWLWVVLYLRAIRAQTSVWCYVYVHGFMSQLFGNMFNPIHPLIHQTFLVFPSICPDVFSSIHDPIVMYCDLVSFI
jgi:hypothetical protein